MVPSTTLEHARSAFDGERWTEAFTLFTNADAQRALDPEDLDRLATAAYLIGNDAAAVHAGTRAHTAFLGRGDAIRAARSAFWLAFAILENPAQRAQAAGWLARAQRLIDEARQPCAEQGWLLCAAARQRVATGDFASAHAAFTEAANIGTRFGDADLTALARHGQGRVLLAMNQTAAGLALLDEVMIAVTGGELGPMITGVVYCSVISACHDIFDLRRAHEWTSALSSWCAAHPDLQAFRSQCRIRRSELMQVHGEWQQALDEAQHVCERLAGSRQPETGAAYYQLGELYRLRGEFARAEEAYRLASVAGRMPQPGLALLRLNQGQADAAAASIRLALEETRGGRMRVFVLSAAVDILLACADSAAARAASDELERLAGRIDAPLLRAMSLHARGAVALAANESLAALECLRGACAEWRELAAPHELGQTRILIALACRELGDLEGAQLELESALELLEPLGAAPAIARVAALRAGATPPISSALTGRELEVLRLMATGVTNRTIAARLGISEKTVARHVSNIFTKLDLPSRAAATAYAYEHKLV